MSDEERLCEGCFLPTDAEPIEYESKGPLGNSFTKKMTLCAPCSRLLDPDSWSEWKPPIRATVRSQLLSIRLLHELKGGPFSREAWEETNTSGEHDEGD